MVMAARPHTVVQVHARYRRPGGEEAVADAEAELLAAHGHRVVRYHVNNADFAERSPPTTARLAVWNRGAAAELESLVRAERAAVVHVHNTFPALSPAVVRGGRAGGAAVVATLHNYRLLCPGANLLRAGAPCQDCVGHVPWRAVAHGCYGGSRAASAVSALTLQAHRAAGTWRQVDAFIALTPFARDLFGRGGLPLERMHVKPNFLAADPGAGEGGQAFLFVGRLDRQKGVEVLLRAWAELEAPPELRIVGEGPLEGDVRAASTRHPSIRPLGRLPGHEVLAHMRHAAALVVPSISYEGFPMVVAEAFASALPVIAADHGALATIVEDGVNGVRVRPGDAGALAAAVRRLADRPELRHRLGEAARRCYLDRYTAPASYAALARIYGAALARRGKG